VTASTADATAAFDDHFRRVRSRLDPALAVWVSDLLADIPLVDRTALEATLTRGKKVRGVLLCLVAEALGGDLEKALPRAAAVELVQTASLIHDDVIDRDTVRRGMPAVWAHEGVHRAILIGDVLFASAIARMSELGREDGLIISRAIAEIARGACLEPVEHSAARESSGATEDHWARYETIIRLKTAILFEAACRLGASGAGAEEAVSGEWGRYGLRIGEAYQIADDLHDLRACLERGAVEPLRLAPLLPVLLGCAAKDDRLLLEAPTADRWQGALPLVRSAVAVLEREVERRLVAAADAVDGSVPVFSAQLLRRAPWEFIRLFDREGNRPSPSRP
jgi:geranylgeranyl pyrophosphate synthase